MSKNEIAVIFTAKDIGMTSAIGKATHGLKVFKRGVGDWNQEAKKLDGGLASLAGKFSALFGGVSTAAFGKSVFDAGLIVDRLNHSFTAITGSAGAAQQELNFIKEKANELGLEFASSADAYKKLMAAAKDTPLEGQQTREIFLGIGEAAAVLNLSAEQTEGALNAIGQMMSKGNVQAEELRGQLGERLPGAFQIAAKAMGVTTRELDKMLEKGEVTAVDMLPKLAKALHDQYGKASLEAGKSATAGVNRFKNAWLEFRSVVAKSGFMDVATDKIRDITNALNDPEIQKSVSHLTMRFTEMAESALNFGINHGEAIAKIGGGLIVMSALSRTTHLLIGIWKGLNAAMLVTAGLELIPYLARLRASLELTKIAALGATGALGVAAGGALAYLAGLNIGEQIYKATDPAEVALTNLRHEIDLTAAKYRQFASFTPETKESLFEQSERDLEAYKQKLEGAYRYQAAMVQSLYAASRETNFWGKQTTEAKQAEVELVAAKSKLKEIEEAMGAYGEAAKRAHEQAATAAKHSSAEEKATKLAALEEIEKKYQEYANTVKRLEDEIAGKRQSLVERLRSLGREGMSDLGAWKDQQAEADEYLRKMKMLEEEAKAVAAAGNSDLAKQKLEEARSAAQTAGELYDGLSNKVEENGRVVISNSEGLKTRTEGIRAAVEAEIKLMEEERKLLAENAQKMNEDTGGALANKFPEAAKAFGELNEKIEDLGKKSSEFNTAWNESWDRFIDGGEESISTLEKSLAALTRDRNITVHVREVVEKATGGPIHKFARGGKLPGYGGGDRVRALLEPGEFVVRKEAVAKYGLVYLQALNSMRLNGFSMIRARIGGLIGSANTGYQRFQQGGPIGANTPSETINVNLNLPVQGKPIPFKMDRKFAIDLMRQLEAMHRGRS